MYDPCADRESAFYSVNPRGCNGHRLEILAESHCEINPSSTNPPGCGVGDVHLLATAEGAFWTLRQTIYWQSDNDSKSRIIPFESSSGRIRLIEFDASSRRLYLIMQTSDIVSTRVSAAVLAVDVDTGIASTIANLVDTIPTTIRLRDGRMVFVTSPSATVFRQSIAGSSALSLSDFDTCAAKAPFQPLASFVDSSVVDLYPAPARLDVIDVETCELRRMHRVKDDQSVPHRFVVASEELYLQQCDAHTLNCELSRIATDDERTLVATGYFSYSTTPFVDSDEVYIATRREPSHPPRLYAWTDGPRSMTVMAAPVTEDVLLSASSKHVYGVVGVGPLDLGAPETTGNTLVTQLFRVTR